MKFLLLCTMLLPQPCKPGWRLKIAIPDMDNICFVRIFWDLKYWGNILMEFCCIFVLNKMLHFKNKIHVIIILCHLISSVGNICYECDILACFKKVLIYMYTGTIILMKCICNTSLLCVHLKYHYNHCFTFWYIYCQ